MGLSILSLSQRGAGQLALVKKGPREKQQGPRLRRAQAQTMRLQVPTVVHKALFLYWKGEGGLWCQNLTYLSYKLPPWGHPSPNTCRVGNRSPRCQGSPSHWPSQSAEEWSGNQGSPSRPHPSQTPCRWTWCHTQEEPVKKRLHRYCLNRRHKNKTEHTSPMWQNEHTTYIHVWAIRGYISIRFMEKSQHSADLLRIPSMNTHLLIH